MYDFNEQVVIVSGAAQGIGLSVVTRLAQSGAKVIALDTQSVKAKASQDAGKGSANLGSVDLETIDWRIVDVSDSKAVKKIVQDCFNKFGRIDVLINVAGILRLGAVENLNDDDWNACFNVNTFGVFNLCRAVIPFMKEQRSGAIVTVGSNAAHVPRTDMAAYAASKSATRMFCQCLALELAPYGVRCNQVSPGSTDTPMQRNMWQDKTGEQKVIQGFPESYKVGIPLGKIAKPDEITNAILFFASSQATHIIMQDLVVDGGASLGA
ncbi:2,3-dihydro-2,3-dihydroxybenzoate dehydrogenase [Aliikangiella coralliicola]|uniref:2,3-dihydro-2,3-dihydroxybenzoate dehydrogenase n=1 Tax=Aliikangiella coralliicola TaxID=2592383 RepID=A0A545UCB8_9GAMM|nr:2,3-dihydro-2,3-dihydroxybenzoate dehydrogenase [Aliikangiella coralliicola]TQV87107.1 2,3-dihydro-2,3-dihydroxybenzoate dehydrogenase [Aliikangiella coralliicola]